MRTVNITAAAHAALRSAASASFEQTGIKKSDGTYDVPFQQSTLDEIVRVAFDGETLSDTIIRMISKRKGMQ